MEQHAADAQLTKQSTRDDGGQLAARASAIERRTNGNDELHELLTVDEVAALLKVSRSWVYEHTRARRLRRGERLPQIKIGKYVRFDARAVRAFLEKKCHVT